MKLTVKHEANKEQPIEKGDMLKPLNLDIILSVVECCT